MTANRLYDLPVIGNYGVNEEDTESRRPWVEVFVVREASHRVELAFDETLDSYLKRHKIVGIEHLYPCTRPTHSRQRCDACRDFFN